MLIHSQNTNSVFQTIAAQAGVQVTVAGDAHRLDYATSSYPGMQHTHWRRELSKRLKPRGESLEPLPQSFPSPVEMRPQLWARLVLCGAVSG